MTCKLIYFISEALSIYVWIVIISILIGWFMFFNVLNPSHLYVRKAVFLLAQLTEPVLEQIRRRVPAAGILDLSPMILIFGIFLIQYILMRFFAPVLCS